VPKNAPVTVSYDDRTECKLAIKLVLKPLDNWCVLCYNRYRIRKHLDRGMGSKMEIRMDVEHIDGSIEKHKIVRKAGRCYVNRRGHMVEVIATCNNGTNGYVEAARLQMREQMFRIALHGASAI
jgi:hypothetical protein